MIAAILATTLSYAEIKAAINAAPVPIRSFIARRAGCNHWAGEEAYDADRARQIADALRSLRCARIAADELTLRRRYARRRDLLILLDRTEAFDGE
jgi:hypothetical protein